MDNNTYIHINMEKTGILLKKKITEQGYTVKDIQKYLQLSCPQPVYRWLKGKTLPSLDHMLMLSHVLKVHMEDLLAVEGMGAENEEQKAYKVFPHDDAWVANGYQETSRIFLGNIRKRMFTYWHAFCDDGAA